jgi:NAD(P)-dependent dehydrogenase (short-subunit alcohol dehydrogenase family)
VTGRTREAVDATVSALAGAGGEVFGHACDVRSLESVQSVWDAAIAQLGNVDIWINNAGVATPRRLLADLDAESIRSTVDTNLTGSIWGARVALAGMLEQGHGDIYFFEGFGSNDMTQPGISVYGATKRALTYFTKSLAKEYAHTPVRIGSLSPGMVITELMMETSRQEDAERWESTKRILNILADRVETVTPWLVEQVLANQKNGVHIRWLTRWKSLYRFLSPAYRKRDLFASDET